MSWSFVIPGHPPSVNKIYRLTPTGLSKRAVVVEYQTKAALVIRSARPSGWAPEGFIRIVVSIFVTRHVDSDNILKTLMDAIQQATGVNDKWYLPMIGCVHVGVRLQEERVEVTVSEPPLCEHAAIPQEDRRRAPAGPS